MKDLRNRVQLIGNLGTNPEMVNFENGNKLVKFSLATSQTYNNAQGEKTSDTQWHNVVVWGKLAEHANKYLKKGDSLTLEGKIIYRNYEDKAGEKKYFTEIVMSDMVFMPKKNKKEEVNTDLPF